MQRNHELVVGEIVFDDWAKLWGRILSLNGDKARLGQRDLLHRNLVEMDCDAEMDLEEWDARAEYLYQEVKGLVDKEGNAICYEHKIEDYPYYSPSLEENFFETEVFTE